MSISFEMLAIYGKAGPFVSPSPQNFVKEDLENGKIL